MRTKNGIITSAKMTGTVIVTVHRSIFHPKYRKRYRMSKKFAADTNGLDLHEGDLVTITECKPISKSKHFLVTEILEKAPNVGVLADEEGVEKVLHKEKKSTVSEEISVPGSPQRT